MNREKRLGKKAWNDELYRESIRLYNFVRTEDQIHKARIRTKKWRLANPEKTKLSIKNWKTNNLSKFKQTLWRWRLKNLHGITPEIYNTKLKRQNGKCAVCHKKPRTIRLAIDHNHKTQKVRDLLCGSCNRALGLIKEDISILQAMIEYIERHK